MKKMVYIKFEVFDESIKQKAMMIVSDCPGVTSVKVKEEGILKVKGEFDKSEMMKKLKMIDEHVDIIEVGPDGVALPEINKPSDDAGSSKWITSQPNGLWEMAKVIGAGAAGLILPNNRENGIKKQAKQEEVYAARMGKRFGWDQPDQPQEGGGIVKGMLGYLEKRKFREEARRREEWMREDDRNQKKHWMNNEVTRKKGTTHNSEGATTQGLTQGSTTMGKTESLWNTFRSTLSTGQASTSKPPLSTGQANTSTQVQRSTQTQKKKSKSVAKKGKNGN